MYLSFVRNLHGLMMVSLNLQVSQFIVRWLRIQNDFSSWRLLLALKLPTSFSLSFVAASPPNLGHHSGSKCVFICVCAFVFVVNSVVFVVEFTVAGLLLCFEACIWTPNLDFT